MGEYLDRKQVIDLYEKFQPSLAIHVYEFGEALRKLPVTQDSHGEWKEVYLTPEEKCFYGELWECSICRVKDKKSNFCPNCGADMRKEGKREAEHKEASLPFDLSGWKDEDAGGCQENDIDTDDFINEIGADFNGW